MVTIIGKYLKLIRLETGDSLRVMSQKLGISSAYLSSIENGKRSVPSYFGKLIFDAYDLNEKQKREIKDAIYKSTDNLKVDLTSIDDNKRKILVSLVDEELDEDVVEQLCEVIESSSVKKTNRGD